MGLENIVIPDKRNEVESDQPALPDEAGNLFNNTHFNLQVLKSTNFQ